MQSVERCQNESGIESGIICASTNSTTLASSSRVVPLRLAGVERAGRTLVVTPIRGGHDHAARAKNRRGKNPHGCRSKAIDGATTHAAGRSWPPLPNATRCLTKGLHIGLGCLSARSANSIFGAMHGTLSPLRILFNTADGFRTQGTSIHGSLHLKTVMIKASETFKKARPTRNAPMAPSASNPGERAVNNLFQEKA